MKFFRRQMCLHHEFGADTAFEYHFIRVQHRITSIPHQILAKA